MVVMLVMMMMMMIIMMMIVMMMMMMNDNYTLDPLRKKFRSLVIVNSNTASSTSI